MEASNMKAMREAWDKVARCMDEILVRTELDSIIHRKALEAQNLADAALLEPPRQCDVGTAEEQCERFMNRCSQFNMSSDMHKLVRKLGAAILAWAQLPCEEGAADGSK